MSQLDKVRIIERELISDDRGWFLKAITGKEDCIPGHTGEVYLTMGRPGQSKGSHYHPKALEWFTLIAGNVILRLEDIETFATMDIELSLDKAITVFVPNNVAHIIMNNSDEDFILLAYTDVLYDPSDTIPYTFE